MSAGSGAKHSYGSFDLVRCTQVCIERVVEEKGLKILLMDKDTSDLISMSYSFSDLLQKDLYLIDMLASSRRQGQGHLKALLFLRPTDENVQAICSELRNPLYAEYHIFFTNIAENSQLEEIALADEFETVKHIHEIYSDYFPLHPYAFTCDVQKPLLQVKDLPQVQDRVVDALVGVLLSVRKRPSIRYQLGSDTCSALAKTLNKKMNNDSQLFEFRKTEDCILLIVDRCDDLISPLLTQWTYEAMVHEEFGLSKHKTTVPTEPKNPDGAPRKMEDMNLVPSFDTFWHSNLHSTWGDLCSNVKTIVDTYKAKTDLPDTNTSNLAGLKEFMDKMPELKKESITMGKHTTIAAELGRVIRSRNLLEVSMLEQDLVCSNSHKEHVERLKEMLDDSANDTGDLVRLVLLYCIRWERSRDNQAASLKDNLRGRRCLSASQEAALDNVLAYGGHAKRASDLFDDKKLTSILKAAVKGMQDVENVYTQHDPLIKKTISNLLKGKLSADAFPYLGTNQSARESRPKEVIVFIAGGVTYEEVKAANDLILEHAKDGLKLIIGGTDVLTASATVDAMS